MTNLARGRAGHAPVTVFDGGIVRTMDGARPVARSLVVEGERIVAVDEEPAGARRVDLAGGCLLPGFTDSHVHFPTWAVTRRELRLDGLRDAVLRDWRAHEALELQAALEALTATPAWLEGNEERRGRLKPGMLADLVILDRDPFDDLAGAQVVDTWLAGRSTVSA